MCTCTVSSWAQQCVSMISHVLVTGSLHNSESKVCDVLSGDPTLMSARRGFEFDTLIYFLRCQTFDCWQQCFVFFLSIFIGQRRGDSWMWLRWWDKVWVCSRVCSRVTVLHDWWGSFQLCIMFNTLRAGTAPRYLLTLYRSIIKGRNNYVQMPNNDLSNGWSLPSRFHGF